MEQTLVSSHDRHFAKRRPHGMTDKCVKVQLRLSTPVPDTNKKLSMFVFGLVSEAWVGQES